MLRCWRFGVGPFRDTVISELLVLRINAKHHGLIEPERMMSLREFQSAIEATGELWEIDEA